MVRSVTILSVVVWVVAPAAMNGCATLPACPAHGGPVWRELSSPHFTLRTDQDESDARTTIDRLEEVRAAMLSAVWAAAGDPPIRTEAIVLRSRREFEAFQGDAAATFPIDGLRASLPPFPSAIVLGGTDGRSFRVLNHELAHDISYWFIPIQPSWYAEGVAKYLETITADRSTGVTQVGRPSPDRVAVRPIDQPIDARALLDDRFSTTRNPNLEWFERRAWLLVHYLVTQRPTEFNRLQVALQELKPTPVAWAQALPDLPVDKLDQVLDDYARNDAYRVVQRPFVSAPPAVASRVMTDAEVHSTRARLLQMMPMGQPDPQAVKGELAEARAADPSNVEALAYQIAWFTAPADRASWAGEAARVAAAHPDDWRAWLAVDLTASSDAARRAALVRALALSPDQPAVLAQLAVLDLAARRPDQALLFADKGMSAHEQLWLFVLVRLQAQVMLGHCAEAAGLADIVRARAPADVAERLDQQWPHLQATCAKKTTTDASQPATAPPPPN
ncbi:MAG TPA: hypothetical protein VMT03_24900 [Polyangia bacterium]|nr:hypothetical protein [Polyangia bacterium]